jgi:hypothetical protein
LTHIGATAYAYLDSMWMHGYASERGMYEMLQTLPDVVVHFGQSELAGMVLVAMLALLLLLLILELCCSRFIVSLLLG